MDCGLIKIISQEAFEIQAAICKSSHFEQNSAWKRFSCQYYFIEGSYFYKFPSKRRITKFSVRFRIWSFLFPWGATSRSIETHSSSSIFGNRFICHLLDSGYRRACSALQLEWRVRFLIREKISRFEFQKLLQFVWMRSSRWFDL